jgi:metal-sulfur cluster biosynthetic enzyme
MPNRTSRTGPMSPRRRAMPPEEIDRLTDDIIGALKTVYDPEIPAIFTNSA